MDIHAVASRLQRAVDQASLKENLKDKVRDIDVRVEALRKNIQDIELKASPEVMEEFRKLQDLHRKVEVGRDSLDTIVGSCVQIVDKLSFEERVLVGLQKVWGVVSSIGVDELGLYLTRTVSAIYGRDIDVRVDYAFKGKVREANVYIKEAWDLEPVLIEFCGGSFKTVIGLVLTMLYIINRKLPKILVLDEALADLSDEVLKGMIEYLSTSGFKVLHVTFDPRVSEDSSRILKEIWIGDTRV